jgi:hypothetical protein
MIRALFCLLLLPLAAAAAPRLELAVHLDPDSRELVASARLEDAAGIAAFSLDPAFAISALRADGQAVAAKATQQDGRRLYRLAKAARSVSFAYRGRLQPLAGLDHRQVLGALPAMAGSEGSFLSSGAGWYPDPGRAFSYRLNLRLPTGQKGLVPGDLVRESDDGEGYRAEYVFDAPAEGIDLMAGPYAVDERIVQLDGGRTVRVRTWFHPDLASLAPGYLEDSARYIQRYSRLIGDYPFALFSVVSSPLPTGFGMPGLAYLGRDVLRLPFIRATSLGHEVLHNWWGNGVYPDWGRGNWSEGLTTFLADYAYKEEAGAAAAREMRLGWLRDLTAVPPGEDIALRDFVARRHGISSIVGYNKSAMVFLMLQDRIGREAFARGLRLLWQRKRFQTASWADLEAAFSAAAGQPLGGFFQQWVTQPGSPSLRLAAARQAAGELQLQFAQADDRALRVPVRLVGDQGSEDRWVEVAGRGATVTLPVRGRVRSVQLDPDYRLWRRLDPALLPAILREVFAAPKAALAVAGVGEEMARAAQGLASQVLDAGPALIPPDGTLPDSATLLVIGAAAEVDAWLARRGLPARPAIAGGRGTAQVWAGRDGAGRPHAVVSVRDVAALQALQRGLPHYGKQGWLVFEGGRAIDKGVGAAGVEEVSVQPARLGG